jgi:16S rRNA (guanine527-N7)-methyltransferase
MESANGLRNLLSEMEISAESNSAVHLLHYLRLLEKWNARMNLTARTEWSALRPLFYESIWASRHYPADSANHLDIGSGAGFPAIILKILLPQIRLDVVESRSKKGAFLETVAHALEMKETCVHVERLDSLLGRCDEAKVWDCVTWKGIRLGSRDLLELRRHANDRTQFWMFHGREPAVESPNVLEKNFTLLRREKSPENREWKLSIYAVKQSAVCGR